VCECAMCGESGRETEGLIFEERERLCRGTCVDRKERRVGQRRDCVSDD
jgi:hypothetical protein